MSLVVTGLHLVKETTTTIGDTTPTFNITLLGAVSGFEAFEDRLGVGNQTYCYIRDNTAWMFFLATLTAFNTLRVDTVIASSDSDNPLVLGTGTKNVYVSLNEKVVDQLILQGPGLTLGRVMALINGSHAG